MKKIISLLILIILILGITACAAAVKSFDAPTEEPRSRSINTPQTTNTNAPTSLYKPGMELVPWTRTTVNLDQQPFSVDIFYMVKIRNNDAFSIVTKGTQNLRVWKRELHLKDAENPDQEVVINLNPKNDVMYLTAKERTVPRETKLYKVLNLPPEEYYASMNSIINEIMQKHPGAGNKLEYAD